MKTIKKKATRLVTSVMFLASVSSLAYHPLDTVKTTTEVKAEMSFKTKKKAANRDTLNGELIIYSDTADIDAMDTYGYSWNLATKTLTLDGFNMVSSNSPALILPLGSTIYLAKDSVNKINLKNECKPLYIADFAESASSCGICVATGTTAGGTSGLKLADANSATLNIRGFGSLNVSVGYVDVEFAFDSKYANVKNRVSVGAYACLDIGSGIDYPEVNITTKDDLISMTYDGTARTTGHLCLYRNNTFTMNSGKLFMQTGTATTSSPVYLNTNATNICVYNGGELEIKAGKTLNENSTFAFVGVGNRKIDNQSGNDISITDSDGQEVVWQSLTYQNSKTGKKASSLIVKPSKSISVGSTDGIFTYGQSGSISLDYSIVANGAQTDGDTIVLQVYDEESDSFISTLPTGLSYTVDSTTGKVTLVSDGTVPSKKYNFRLAIIDSNGKRNPIYSNEISIKSLFTSDGSEYTSNVSLSKASNDEEPTKTNGITVTANKGYEVSLDGINYTSSVSYGGDTDGVYSSKLYIRRTTDGGISEVDFDYTLDTVAPTATFDGKTEYVTPTEENAIHTNKSTTLTLSDVSDGSSSEESKITKEYVILNDLLSDSELKAKDDAGEITWTTASSTGSDEDGNPTYDITLDGENEMKVVYVKITDEAGNVTYRASDAYEFDKTAPTISGITDGNDYYVSTGFATSEDATVTYTTSESDTPITLEKNSDGKYVLPGNVKTTYTVTVTDEAGNVSTYTVNMNKTADIEGDVSKLTEETVTSEDYDDIKSVIESIDTLDVSSATEEEKEELATVKEHCNSLLSKISDIKKQIEAIDKVKDYSSTTITSNDKTALETLRDNAKDLSTSDNLTEEEKANALADYNAAVELLKKIQEVADDMTSVTDAIGNLTTSNVTSDDETKLNNALTTISNLTNEENNGNLTEEEKAKLASQKEYIENLLKKIESTKEEIKAIDAVKDYSSSTVTSDNQTELETLRDNALALSTSDNLTEEEKANALADYNAAVELLKKIQEVADDMTSVTDAIGNLTTSNVTSDDVERLNGALDTIDDLLKSENLTTAEQTALAKQQEYINSLLAKVAEVKTDMDSVSTVIGDLTIETVTADNKASLTEAMETIDDLFAGSNLTADEIKTLTTEKETIQALLDKIDEIASDVKSVSDAIGTLTPETVTADDKSKLTDAKETADTLINGSNLTEEQKTQVEADRATIERLLAELQKDEDIAEIDKAAKGYDIDTVTSADKDDIESIIENIDKVLNDYADILSDEEKTSLEQTKATLNSYIDRINTVEDLYKSVTDVTDKTVDTVTSDDKAGLESVKETVDNLLNNYSGNLTEDEKARLTAAKDKVDPLIEKIAEIEQDIDDLEATNSKYTPDTVTSNDETSIKEAIEDAEALLNGSNLTETERENIQAIIDNLNACLDRIAEVKSSIDALDKATEGKTVSTVTSDDKKAIEDALNDVNNILDTNLTDEEKEELATKKENAEELLSKIEETSKSISDINSSISNITDSNVNSDNKKTIEDAISDIDALLNGNNLTDTERTALTDTKNTLNSYLEKIENVKSAIDGIDTAISGITESNVNSDDKKELEDALEDIKELLDENNLTAAERTDLEAKKAEVTKLIGKIGSVKETIDSVNGSTTGLTTGNVNSDNKTALEEAKSNVEELLAGDNLTDEERTALETKEDEIDALLSQIKTTSDSIAAVDKAMDGITDSNVNSDNKATLEKALEDIDELLKGDNLTTAERTALEAKKTTVTGLLNKIEAVKSTIDSVSGSTSGITTDNVTSENKNALEEAKKDAEELLSGENLTTAERTALTAKKAEIDSLLDKINEVSGKIDSVSGSTTGITTDNVNSDKKTALEEAKKEAEELLAGENLTTEERTALTAKKTEIQTLLDKIESTNSNIDAIDTAIDGITDSNVNSDNKTALEKVLEDIEALLNGNNLTDTEKKALEAKKTTVQSLLDKIDNVAASIKDVSGSTTGITTDNVNSNNKSSLEEAKQEAEELLAGENLTTEERTALTAKKTEIDSLLDKIDEVSGKIDSVSGSTSGLTTDNVTSDNKTSLEDAKNTVDSLLASDNLTAEEKEALTAKKAEIQNLLDKIESTNSNIGAIDAAIDGITEDNVTSDDKATLEKTLEDIEGLLNGSNLTDEEKEELTKKKNRIHILMAKVNKVQEDIDKITDASTDVTTGNVTSDNKEALEDAKAKAEELLAGDNLTDKERTVLTSAKTNVDTLLSTISTVNSNYEDVKTALSEYEKGGDLDSLVSKAEELKNSDNLTEEEKAELTKLIQKATEIETAKKSLWWLVLVALGCLTVIGAIAFHIIRKKEDKEEKKNQKK